MFFNSNTLPGRIIDTDGWKGYSNIVLAGYCYELQDPENPRPAYIHRVFGELPNLAIFQPCCAKEIMLI